MNHIKQDVIQALRRFERGNLKNAAISLFDTLGYRSDIGTGIEFASPEDFLEQFDTTQKLNRDNSLIEQWQSVEVLFQLTGDDIKETEQLGFIFEASSEAIDNTIIESYLFLAMKLKGQAYSRTALSNITREINKLTPMPAIILFQHGQTLTLSVINRRLHKSDESRDVLEKVTLIKDIAFATPHRAHIEILFDLSLEQLYQKHGFTNFVALHRSWQKTLDSSELNKRFFREVANWYFWAVEQVTFPKDAGEDVENRNATSVIRLITRLIFVWFLKEKVLIPDVLFNQSKLQDILNFIDPRESTYYKAILQNLFFATLNQKMNTEKEPDNRKFRGEGRQHYNITSLYRYKRYFKNPDEALCLFESIPFLNGGLFECLDKPDKDNSKKILRIDGFSDRDDNELVVPDFLFFADERNIDLNKTYGTRNKRYKVRGILNILDSYKFTINENTPIEEEVALDPELLGKVFENLLAAYNPETGATARKQTGSFYTPREIVNYMVDESLIAYLESKLNNTAPDGLTNPAEIRLRHLIAYNDEPHRFNEQEVERLIEAIDTIKILDPACGSGAFPMGILHKLVYILGKLDPGNERWKAKQIAKISKIIPASADREKVIAEIEQAFERNELDYGRKLFLIENCIYGVDIQPIAVQIAKLRFFISLVVDQKIDDTQENRGIIPLPNLETKFVAANTLIGIDNQLSLRTPEIAQKEEELADVRRRHFTARTPRTKAKYRELDAKLRAEISELLNKSGLPSETTAKLAFWDPYDQNASAGFFDSEWMFGIRDVFDVVIGNPPYILLQNIQLDDIVLNTIFTSYYSAQYKVDTYHLFIERGIELLATNGIISYITPNTFLKNKYTNKLREIFVRKTLIHHLVRFYVKVFQDPSVDNLIFICSQLGNSGEVENHKIQIHDIKSQDFTSEILNVRFFPQSQIKPTDFTFEIDASQAELEIIAKLEDGSKPFGRIGKSYFGIQTFNRSAFVSNQKKSSYFKPVIDGANVLRYALIPPSEYIDYRPENIKSGGNFEVYNRDRIVVRQIGEYPEGCLCPRGIFTLNTIYNLYITDDAFDIRFILALVNSKVIRFYWLSRFYDNKKTFPKIKKTPLNSIPIKDVSHDMQVPIIALVDRILAAKRADPDADISALEHEIDQLVYALYDLTPEEITIVEKSTTEG